MMRHHRLKFGLLFPRLLLIGSLLLVACSQRPPFHSEVVPLIAHMRVPPVLPLPQTLHVERDDGQKWVVLIQKERDEHDFIRFRFSLFDPLGAPLAHVLLVKGRRWTSDGWLPPNREIVDLLDTFLQVLHGRKPHPSDRWHWSPRAPEAPLNEYGFPVESPYPFQTWPSVRLCKHGGYCYQFTPVQTP